MYIFAVVPNEALALMTAPDILFRLFRFGAQESANPIVIAA
ncbi:hypothetical protein [Jiella sp. M17.18]